MIDNDRRRAIFQGFYRDWGAIFKNPFHVVLEPKQRWIATGSHQAGPTGERKVSKIQGIHERTDIKGINWNPTVCLLFTRKTKNGGIFELKDLFNHSLFGFLPPGTSCVAASCAPSCDLVAKTAVHTLSSWKACSPCAYWSVSSMNSHRRTVSRTNHNGSSLHDPCGSDRCAPSRTSSESTALLGHKPDRRIYDSLRHGKGRDHLIPSRGWTTGHIGCIYGAGCWYVVLDGVPNRKIAWKPSRNNRIRLWF